MPKASFFSSLLILLIPMWNSEVGSNHQIGKSWQAFWSILNIHSVWFNVNSFNIQKQCASWTDVRFTWHCFHFSISHVFLPPRARGILDLTRALLFSHNTLCLVIASTRLSSKPWGMAKEMMEIKPFTKAKRKARSTCPSFVGKYGNKVWSYCASLLKYWCLTKTWIKN